MNTALWIVAGLLSAAYLFAGFSKLLIPQEKIAKMSRAGEWVLDFSPGTVKAIAVAEILGAVGLTLPGLLGVAPVLVPLAALGLALIMIGAVIVRLRRHELKYALVDLVYLALAAFVAVGRFGPVPLTA